MRTRTMSRVVLSLCSCAEVCSTRSSSFAAPCRCWPFVDAVAVAAAVVGLTGCQ
jgi:hypothetical protein